MPKLLDGKKTVILAWLFALIGIPVLSQIILFIAGSIVSGLFMVLDTLDIPNNASDDIAHLFFIIFYLPAIFGLGIACAARKKFKNHKWNYYPCIIIIFYILIVWVVALLITQDTISDTYIGILAFSTITFFFVILYAAFTSKIIVLPVFVILTYLSFLLGMIVSAKRKKHVIPLTKKQVISFSAAFSLLVMLIAVLLSNFSPALIKEAYLNDQTKISEDVDLHLYAPFSSSTRLTPLRSEATLKITKDYPRIDGATAAFPVYASAVQSIYNPNNEEDIKRMKDVVKVSKTPVAYQRLIDNQTDILIVAQPSKSQIENARQKGAMLKLTPIAKEAFVFIVSKENPVTNLTVEQIRDIYSGKVNNWKKMGGGQASLFWRFKDLKTQVARVQCRQK